MDTYRIKAYLKNLREKDTLVSLAAGFVAVLAIVALIVFMRSIRNNQTADTTPSPTPSPAVVTTLPEQVTYHEENGQKIPADLPVTYEVQPGDSTWKIAQAFYGSGYNYVDIEQANQLKPDQGLVAGQQLVIPRVAAKLPNQVVTSPAASEATTSAQIAASPLPAGDTKGQTNEEKVQNSDTAPRMYVVQKGDSLWKIADQELGSGYRWVEIYRANRGIVGANPDLIYPDQKFELPAN